MTDDNHNNEDEFDSIDEFDAEDPGPWGGSESAANGHHESGDTPAGGPPAGDGESDEPVSVQAGRTVGGGLTAVALFPFRLAGGIAAGVLGKLPGRTNIYRKLIKAGYKGLYKKTGAHVIAHTIYGDSEMVPRVAKVDEETGNLETANGEEWTVESGLNPTFVGDVPVVTGVSDHHELVDPVAARTAEAVDLSHKRFQEVVETNAGVHPVNAEAGGGDPGALADGGQSALPSVSTFDDIWVDARNPEDGNDGWIVSMDKAYALHWDQAGSEEMENQEMRGILAAQDPNKSNKRMIIIAALIFGAFCVGLFGPALASNIAGGDGGGGVGGGISMMVEMAGWWL